MAISVTLYRFQKDRASTKRPLDSTTQREEQVTLKEGSSVMSPVLLLRFTQGTPHIWNYVRIPDWGRYYFVNDWVNVQGNLWEVHLSVDVLGSFKNEIETQYQFIERASNRSNGNIFDALALGTTVVTTDRMREDSPWRSGGSDYVVEILGNGNSQYYIFRTESAYNEFISYLFSDDYVDSIFPDWQTAFPEIKAQLNPLQYIGSVRVFPVFLPTVSAVDSVYVGFGKVPVNAYLAEPDAAAQSSMIITFPSHPQSVSAPYLKNAPYSNYEIWYPPFGTIPIDSGIVANNPDIRCLMRIDIRTGQGRLDILGGSPQISLGIVTAQIGMNVAISSTIYNGVGSVGLVGNAFGIATAIATGNISGGVNAATSTLQNFIGNLTPYLMATGSNTGNAGFSGEVAAMCRFQRVVLPDYTRVGYPLYTHATPLELDHGYIQCRGTELSIANAYVEEIEQLKSLMNGGFYYE